MNPIKQKQRNSWTKQQDEALIYIKDVLKVKKWTDVAKKLKQMYNLHERKDKHCRDRYENFLMQAEQRKKTWTSQHDVKLIQLYLQYGNKWSQMAHLFDEINGVYIKNKFYSRMRKGIRTVNYLVDAFFLRNWKKLQTDIVFKLVTCAAQKFDYNSQSPIGKKLEQKITFIEQIVSKVFMLSFVDKMNIKKSPKQSKESALDPQEIQHLMEEINFIDENTQKKRSNKTFQNNDPINKQRQNLKTVTVKIEYQTIIQQEDHNFHLDGIINQGVQKQFKQSNSFTENIPNKRIQIITKNSFESQYEKWNTDYLLTKRQNLNYQELYKRKKTPILSNEIVKKRSGYRQIIHSLDQTPKDSNVKSIKYFNIKQQFQDKQHNQQNHSQKIFCY